MVVAVTLYHQHNKIRCLSDKDVKRANTKIIELPICFSNTEIRKIYKLTFRNGDKFMHFYWYCLIWDYYQCFESILHFKAITSLFVSINHHQLNK